jgi:hypothetical protein
MAGWRHSVDLAMTDEEIARLTAISRDGCALAARQRQLPPLSKVA